VVVEEPSDGQFLAGNIRMLKVTISKKAFHHMCASADVDIIIG
jgi:hypothetical protein